VQANPTDADLSVALMVDDASPLEGSTVVYTVSVTNQGPAVATGVALTDQLPAGLTYVNDDAASTGTLYDGDSGVWTVGTVLAGQTVSLNLTASVDADTVGVTLTNTASVSGVNETDPVPGNDSASVSVTVVDLSVSQAVDNASPLEGSTLVYAVSVTNQSLAVATGVALTDQLPAGLTYVSDDAASTGTMYDSGVWTVGTVLAGQTVSLNLTASVDADTVGSTLTNTASVSGLNEKDPVLGNDIASVSVTVLDPNSVDLSVSQTMDDASLASIVITDIMFDMSTVKNVAPENDASASESDNWPITWSGNDHQYTAFGDGKGFRTFNTTRASLGVARIEGSKDNYSAFDIFKTGEKSDGWSGKSLGILALGTELYMFRNGTKGGQSAFQQTEMYHSTDNGFSWDFTGVRWLRSEFSGNSGIYSPTFLQFGKGYSGARDYYVYIYANEIASESWNVQRPGRISLFRVPRDSLDHKGAYKYFSGLDANNNPIWSSLSSDRVPVFSDDVNGNMRTSVSYNAGLGRYILTTQQVSRYQADDYHIGIYEAPEPWGPWRTVLFANPADVGPELNRGYKTVNWNFSNKWLSSDGREFVMVYTGPGPDEWGTVEGRFVTPLLQGSTVMYTVSVTNQGLAVATGVAMMDQLPAGLTYVSDDAASTGTFYDSGSGVWTVGTVLAGQKVSLNLTAYVNTGMGESTLTNTASVIVVNEIDPVPGNDSASVSVTVLDSNSVDLSVGQAVDDASPLEGSTVVCTVSVTNQSLVTATGVALMDQLPAGLTYVSDDATGTGTLYDSGSGVWTLGTVLAGQTVSLNLTASVDADTVGSILTNTASVSGLNETDPVPGNDSASVSMTVSVPSIPFLQDGGAQSVVSMEAENYLTSVVAPDGHEWLSAGAGFPGFAGTDALQTLPEDEADYTTGYSMLSPRLDYQVNFVATGTHYVWVRAWGPTLSSNSVHVGLDGQELATGENMSMPGNQMNDYVWVSTSLGGVATVDINTTGVHTVNVWARETGVVVDKVVLTTDPAYDPSTVNGDLGPNESMLEGGSVVEKPTINPNGGVFSNSVVVTLASDTPGAAIYYTLDGSDPTLSANEYTGPFSLTISTTLRARAFLSGYVDSAIETVFFQIKPLPSGLDLYLPFNEASGSTFTDTIAGVNASCVLCPTLVAGRVSGAQSFDGIDDEVSVPGVGSFDWANSDRFSLEVWVNKSSLCVASESIIGRHEASSSLHWWLGCENGVASFTLIDSSGVGATISGVTNITDGQWHHLMAVRDAISGDIRLYVDGVEEATALISYSGDFSGTAEVNIGWLNDSAMDYHFAGTIDELALHSRVLSQAEISRHYMDGAIGLRRGYLGCESPVRIMPLGDSVTGALSQGGYRPKLYFDLVDAGYEVDFVGSKTDFSGSHDRDHEGHGGFTASDIAASLNSWLTQYPPDAVLLHIGSNEDPAFPYPSTGGVETLHNIIDSFDPSISIVQARIINKVPYDPLITQFNDNVVAIVAARVATGENIAIADHESALNYIDDMDPDGNHPVQSGYEKMASVWFEQLASFLPTCNQALPQTTSQAITSAEMGVPYEYQLETTGFPSPDFLVLSAPAGMTIHPDTGQINWLPGVTGMFNVSVQVQNAAGAITHDFTVSVSSAQDTDADGMLDSWEITHFGDLSRDGTGDFDSDGATDLEEHDAGTDPLNPGSYPGAPDGDINGDGQVNAVDVLLAVRIVLGLYIPTADEFQRGDVAPLISGVPSPDAEINAGDLLLIQRKALGLINF